MKLRTALEAAGESQGKLAEALGVSQASVSKWVREERPIPSGRVSPIERFLGMDPGTLERGGKVKVSFGFEDAPTVLGFLVIGTELGGSPVERLNRIADALGVSAEEVEAWCHGHRRIPFKYAAALCREFWPGVNPAVFAHESGREVSEYEAVRSAISKARLFESGPTTFDAVIEAVEDARREWEADPTKALEWEAVYAALDNETQIPLSLRDRMRQVARRQS